MDKILIIMIIGIMAIMLNASADTTTTTTTTLINCHIEALIRNAYNFDEIDNAKVYVYAANDSYDLLMNTTTASDGLAEFDIGCGNYSFVIQRGGFNTQSEYKDFTESMSYIFYLTQATLGGVNFEYTDLTLNTHPICLFKLGNFWGCYYVNETISLTDGNYSLYVKQNAFDTAADTSNLIGILKTWIPFIIVLLLIIGFVIFVFAVIIYIAKRAV